MLAWVRTATSLITFGFAIYSFFGLPSGAGSKFTTHLGPHIFALLLIAMGLFSLLGAALQRRQAIRTMKLDYPGLSRFSMGTVVGALMGCLGLFGIVVLLMRV